MDGRHETSAPLRLQKGGRAVARKGLSVPLFFAFGCMFAVMSIYEVLKHALFPGITIWQSHIMSITVVSAGATLAVYVALKQRRSMEDRLRSSIREKEVLLREVHHRVKNNLQVVSSLLYLQSLYIKDETIAGLFREGQERIRAMALVHEKLYGTADLSRVDFAEYVRSLAGELLVSYGITAATVGLHVDIGKVQLDIATAIPCGLVINELVTNALKHAFPMGTKGEITIAARPVGGDRLELTVRDNGVGFPEGFDLANAGTLGLQLVRTLIEPLRGTIELRREGGTAFTIRINMSAAWEESASEIAQNIDCRG